MAAKIGSKTAFSCMAVLMLLLHMGCSNSPVRKGGKSLNNDLDRCYIGTAKQGDCASSRVISGMDYITYPQYPSIQGDIVAATTLPSGVGLTCVVKDDGQYEVHALSATPSEARASVHDGSLILCEYSGDHTRLAVCTDDGVVTVYDTIGMAVLHTCRIPVSIRGEYAGIRDIAFTYDGSEVFLLKDVNSLVRIPLTEMVCQPEYIDTDYGSKVLSSIALAGDSLLWVCGMNGDIWVMDDVALPKSLMLASMEFDIIDILAVSGDELAISAGDRLYFYSRGRGLLDVEYDAFYREPVTVAWCMLPDFRLAFQTSVPTRYRVIDLATHEIEDTVELQGAFIKSLSLGTVAGESVVVAPSSRGRIHLFHAAQMYGEELPFGKWLPSTDQRGLKSTRYYKFGATSPSTESYILVGSNDEVSYIKEVEGTSVFVATSLKVLFRNHIQQCVYLDNDTVAFTDGISKVALFSLENKPELVTTMDIDSEWCRIWPNRTRQEWSIVSLSHARLSLRTASKQSDHSYHIIGNEVTAADDMLSDTIIPVGSCEHSRNTFLIPERGRINVLSRDSIGYEWFRLKSIGIHSRLSAGESQVVVTGKDYVEVWDIVDGGINKRLRFKQPARQPLEVLLWSADRGILVDHLGRLFTMIASDGKVNLAPIATKRPVLNVKINGTTASVTAILVGPTELVRITVE